ncbi:co-regulatory protein PtrA N-terminal domain-containing protein [Pseudomonas izuensis]|uniref:co-regulatory protein PtrA N-terminal domain-containing protein n=1 Tax=Pseudomonas izuensis TaxID=2684212 RepID=UPI0013586C10|nr:co-regulatory protein PtrA N-terminal domain-containing protein [Pseudomonas izuensis]
MKSLKTLLIVTLMTASVAAMAEGGGDTVMAKMEAARATAMTTPQQSAAATATATASNHNTASNDVSRSN